MSTRTYNLRARTGTGVANQSIAPAPELLLGADMRVVWAPWTELEIEARRKLSGEQDQAFRAAAEAPTNERKRQIGCPLHRWRQATAETQVHSWIVPCCTKNYLDMAQHVGRVQSWKQQAKPITIPSDPLDGLLNITNHMFLTLFTHFLIPYLFIFILWSYPVTITWCYPLSGVLKNGGT